MLPLILANGAGDVSYLGGRLPLRGRSVLRISGSVMKSSQRIPPRGCAATWRLPTHSLPRSETHVGLHINYLLLLDFNQNWNVSTNSSKLHTIKFHENTFSGFRIVTCGQTDMAVQIGLFLQLLVAKVPNSYGNSFCKRIHNESRTHYPYAFFDILSSC
jgi:hypothetical protein